MFTALRHSSHGWPGLIVVIGLSLWTGCARAPGATTPDVAPTPSPAMTPVATGSPSPIHTPDPSRSPAEFPTADGELVFRVAPWADIITPYTISLMTDGRLTTIRVGGGSEALTHRRLTAEGVELVRQEILATGLFGESAFFPPVPKPGMELPGRGNSGYIVDFGTDTGTVQVGWVMVTEDEVEWAQPSPERVRLDPLGHRLTTLEAWLPTEAWLEANPMPYVPERYRLFVTAQPWGGELNDLPPEATQVAWPLDGTVLTYGEANQDASPDWSVRCGIVSAVDAERVRVALAAAGAPMGELASAYVIGAGLGHRSSSRVIDVLLVALHPHEDGCVGMWPPSFW